VVLTFGSFAEAVSPVRDDIFSPQFAEHVFEIMAMRARHPPQNRFQCREGRIGSIGHLPPTHSAVGRRQHLDAPTGHRIGRYCTVMCGLAACRRLAKNAGKIYADHLGLKKMAPSIKAK